MQTRFRVPTLVLLAAAIVVPAARGDGGPSPGISLDRTGIADPAHGLAHSRLMPNAIVDKTEPNMRGQPLVRLVGPGGAWVYTLYAHQGGEPFVHALDTVHASARCLDVDWDGNQNLLLSARRVLGH